MADPLSIAASIFGVATTAFAVTKGLYRIADGIGSAGAEVRAYGDEIGAFSKVLRQLRTEVLGQTSASQELQSLLDDVVQLCDRTLSPVKAMLQILSPLLERISGNKNRLSQFGLRVQWIFSYKQKLLFYRSALNAQHRLLQTLLELVILQTTKDRSPENLCLLQLSLHQSVEVTAATVYRTQDKQLFFSADYSQRQGGLMGAPRAIEERSRHLIEYLPDTSSQSSAVDAYRQLEDGASDPNPSFALVRSFKSPATDDSELIKLENDIDQCLDPDDQTSLVRTARDIGITVPRALRLASTEMKQNGLESVFDHRQEKEILSSKPLECVRPSRYTRTVALVVHWASDDMFVLPELEDLERCFKEDYAMKTEIFSIPAENSHVELMMKVGLLIKEHSSRDTLIVLYYGGHGAINEARQNLWKATRSPDAPWLNFSAIQTLLSRIESDVLVLLDCESGSASADFHCGNNLIETLCATSWGDTASGTAPDRYSFTNALIEVLQEWHLKVFSAAMLHSEMLNRMKHPRPITINGKPFDARAAPHHFIQTWNSDTSSIEICRSGTRKA